MDIFVAVVKLGTSFLSSMGITTIVSGAVARVTPENMSKWQKITTCVASGVLGSMLASKADEYIDETVDGLADIAKGVIGIEE